MLAALQRSLIYHPMRAARIDPEDVDFPRGQVHSVQIAAHDGIELHGWLILADACRASDAEAADRELRAGRPLVIYFSGNAGNRIYRGHEVAVLTGQGINVLLVDYRGYGDNAGSPTEELLSQDARTVWDYATRRGVPPEQVLLYGESLGGAVAVRLAAELCAQGTPPRGVILRSTFTSLADVAAYHFWWLPVRWALVEHYPSRDRVPHVTCPLLQIHGSEDTIVPIRFARELFAAAPPAAAGGVAKEFCTIEGVDHNDVVLSAADQVSAAIGRFLSRINQAERD